MHAAGVAIYAMGGGHGHAMRAAAVAAALRITRPALPVRLLLPRRLAWLAQALGLDARHPPARCEASPADLRAWVAATLRDFRPRALVVDVFPRGILGELPPAPAPVRILLTRHVRPAFYAHPPVAAAIATYDAVLWTEGPLLHGIHLRAVPTPPVLLVAPPDLAERGAARDALGVGPDERLLLVLGSGSAAEQRAALQALEAHPPGGWRLRFVSTDLVPRPPHRIRLFPAGRWLRAADAILSAAGYHAVHEALQAGIPLGLVPQERRVDDQAWRAALWSERLPERVRVMGGWGEAASWVESIPGMAPPAASWGAAVAAERLLEIAGLKD